MLTTVYYTHFVAGLTIAVVLWLRDRALWVPWMTRYVAINFAALVIYVLYPMAPPWLASKEGYVAEPLARLTGRGWDDLGLGSFHFVLAKVGNPVAAMPSLHAGLAMLIAMYAVARLRGSWRWLLMIYPLLMALRARVLRRALRHRHPGGLGPGRSRHGRLQLVGATARRPSKICTERAAPAVAH
ncbi:phosphatase PAP2 family protein [Aeromicrobium sp. UC242_57]|uniref:phosphatase PAP2 family protein n=1 Tax=Aeromicrobium sp. UC242_57 TaxID=3374624 RepID=UPI0037B500EC